MLILLDIAASLFLRILRVRIAGFLFLNFLVSSLIALRSRLIVFVYGRIVVSNLLIALIDCFVVLLYILIIGFIGLIWVRKHSFKVIHSGQSSARRFIILRSSFLVALGRFLVALGRFLILLVNFSIVFLDFIVCTSVLRGRIGLLLLFSCSIRGDTNSLFCIRGHIGLRIGRHTGSSNGCRIRASLFRLGRVVGCAIRDSVHLICRIRDQGLCRNTCGQCHRHCSNFKLFIRHDPRSPFLSPCV